MTDSKYEVYNVYGRAELSTDDASEAAAFYAELRGFDNYASLRINR